MKGLPYVITSSFVLFIILVLLDSELGFRFAMCLGLAAIYGEAAAARLNGMNKDEVD